ncbi:uncharacterized protein LOC139926157 [Centroberyx gerrardi]
MAEEGSVFELEGFEKQLVSLFSRYSSDELQVDSKPFCSDFCKLVEEYTSRWQVPLPQLRILEMALCYFVQASSFFSSNCDHVLYTLSSLALSVFELLLFFDQKDFHQDPLKHFTVTFQECHLALARHQNVHLLQVKHLVQDGGPWASSALQAVLTESNLPQNEVDGYISSELPVFFELRVRYLFSCERVSEAMALAKCCARHPTAGQHLFFLQVYLTWLYKTSQHDHLHKEVVDLNGKDAVHIICSLENEEKDELLLALSRAFLSQQLRRGDMYYLWDLVFIWTKLHGRLNTSKQALLEESHQLMLSATNVNSIFPFIRVILEELGEDGFQFCVELCANALQSCLPCDVVTKSLIYKTIASILPNDLEVCRACALLVFFLERSVEAYKMVYLLYTHPDQEYHAESSPIGNHVRFETLQVLKKGLYFDPEFWNLIALRTNCLKLMSEKVVSAALEEIMEEKWVPNYCTKEPTFCSNATNCRKGTKGAHQAGTKKRHHKEDGHHKEDTTHMASKRIKICPGKTRLSVDHEVKKKGNQGLRSMKESSSESFRRSFWQLDKTQDSVSWQFGYGEHRRITRLSEKNPPKRRIRKPRWLLEDSGTLEENNAPPKVKKHGMKPQHQKPHQASVVKRSASGQVKNNAKHKTSVNSDLKARENEAKHQKGFSVDSLTPTSPPHVILELSQPENELMGTFTEDSCNRQRGYPQMLLYKPIVKLPVTSQPVKAVHRKEVILRARDASTFVQQMHCYARRQKGKGVVSNIQVSVSTITRSSVQGSQAKVPSGELCEKPVVEMKVTIASQTPAAKVTQSPILDMVSEAQTTEKVSQTIASAKVSQNSTADISQTVATDEIPPISTVAKVSNIGAAVQTSPQSQNVVARDEESLLDGDDEQKLNSLATPSETVKNPIAQSIADTPKAFVATLSTSSIDNVKGPMAFANSNAIKESNITAISSNIFESPVTEISAKDSEVHMPCKDSVNRDPADADTITTVQNETIPHDNMVTPSETSEAGATSAPIELHSKEDICALTLVTEVVTELEPEAFDTEVPKEPINEDGASEEVTPMLENKPNVPFKILTTSSCSVTEQGASVIADVQGKPKEERTEDIAVETPENSETMGTPQESEESKLEYCCTLCNKVFKGKRVVVHAMFHYRRDKCMFCGTMFKDDLLAMMHLSEHIEKLKKSKESPGNKAQENCVSDTQEICTPKTSAKAETTHLSSVHHRGRPRKSDVHPKSPNLPDSSPSESRKLRSNSKPMDGQFVSHEKEQNMSKRCTGKTPIHKVNGHFGKSQDEFVRDTQDTLNLEAKQTLTQPEEISYQERTNDGAEKLVLLEGGSSTTPIQVEKEFGCSTEDKVEETESVQVLKATTKQEERAGEENTVEMQEKVCCPVEGCTWYTDLSRNRVALLHHALEDHYGDVKPLELAFRVGKSRCSVCMRVLWSFQHYQHHVERHRLTPRHPCLHQGCSARFKTGMEMRRHTRRHSPLQAVCCLPGCSQLFICLWALNLHEREHYASKPTKPVKETIVQMGNKCNNTQVVKKGQGHKPKDATAVPPVNTVSWTQSIKAARKLRGQATDISSIGKSDKAAPLATARTPLVTEGLKVGNESKDLNVMKNLSNKDTSAHPTTPMRFKKLRKGQLTKKNLAVPKTHKVSSSSLVTTNGKMRNKLKKRQLKVSIKGHKRKGHPAGSTKLKKAGCDEKTITDQKDETVEEKTGLLRGQNSPVQAQLPISPSETAQTSNVNNDLKTEEEMSQQVQDQDVVKTSCTNSTLKLTDKSKLKKSTKKQIKKHHVKQNYVSNSVSMSAVTANNLNETTIPPTTSAEETQELTAEEKSKKLQVTKKRRVPKEKNTSTTPSDLSKANKKHKVRNTKTETGDPKIVKKKRPSKDPGTPSASKKPAKSKTIVQQISEAKAVVESPVGEVGKAKEETPDPTISGPGYSLIQNGQVEDMKEPQKPQDDVANVEVENAKPAPADSLSAYGKKPYIRPPPTAYLDEKYTNMPKRRKEMSMFCHSSQKRLSAEQASAATPPQRQRCANCFVSFSSAEELQAHLQLKKCSNLFGFDSDDEGNC